MRLLIAIVLIAILSGCRAEPAAPAPASSNEAVAGEPVRGTPGDWPQFRGPAGLGVSQDKGVPIQWSADQNIAWKVELPGAGTSSPVTFGDRIYLTCYSGYGVPGQTQAAMSNLKRVVCCLDRADGKLIWTTEVQSRLPDQEASRIREGHGYASHTPAVDADGIYVFFGKSGVAALNHSGKQLWHADVGSNLHGWGTAASPIICKNLLIVNASVESQSLYALDKKNGRQVWQAGGINEAWNTPILVEANGKTELVVAIMGKILAFDPDRGQPLWNCRTDIGWYMVPGLVAENGIIYCVGGRSGGGLAVRCGGSGDVTRTHRLWTAPRGSNVPSPILHNGHLYWAHENLGVVYCADLKTGNLLYEQRLDGAGQIYASPVLADGNIYYISRQGRFYVVQAAPQFRLLAQNEMPRRDRYDSSPAISRGQLLLRTDRYLYCIGS